LSRNEGTTIKQTSGLQGIKQRLACNPAVVRLRLALMANKWRFALLVFVAVYAFLLLYNLGYMSVQWDEMPHLYGSWFLKGGFTRDYLTMYGYYPPLYDLMTTQFFHLLGTSATAGRLTSVLFSILSIWIVFEFTKKAYGQKIALLSSVIMGVMPGFFWFSRIAMLETMLIFFFTLAMLFFLSWIRTHNNLALLLSGLTLGIGFLAKYQILVAGLVMLASVFIFFRKKLIKNLSKVIVVLFIAVLLAVPWVYMVSQANGDKKITEIFYVIQEGAQNRVEYGNRFPLPIFYLVELTWPFPEAPVHPISLPLFILGLLGLGLLAYRRKNEDKLLLAWFAIVYVFFTIIPNRQWRYVTPLFPVLAITAAIFIMFAYAKIREWKPKRLGIRSKKVVAAVFVALAASTIIYSGYDAYQMTARDQIHIPIEEATNYLSSHMTLNESAVIVCAYNMLDQDMLRFYWPYNMDRWQIWQYPELAVDAFTPNFNVTEFVSLCEQRNVKYIVLYDYGAYSAFYNTTLTYANVTTMLAETGRFGDPLDMPFFGEMPHRLFLVRFLNQTQT
jgi:4-amino-4-deoxy-L-arabinose transferase-like glycosyltransferase